MAILAETSDPIVIPDLPSGSIKDFIPYLSKHPDTPIGTLLEPFKAFEGELRKVYAQQPGHEIARDGVANLVPVFAGHEDKLKIRARCIETETEDEKSRFIMPLADEARKPSGVPAIVTSLKDFQNNFNLFSESALADLDWSNVVAAGSSVTTALLPVPEKWAGSKKSLREYYHRTLAPASDVDLFLYGLNEEEGLEKIKQIEKNIKDSILHETTTIRTKNAITIASQYPTRHVQIVLRLYDSISQIITGFDVDCACAAYDGNQVYAAPRAITSFVTQCNTIDLTRRSPSYENRLSKYSRRGFEVHWPGLDRTRIDPTIFERSFGRTQGLARLLILEKLPKSADRDSYMDQRRAERGRPTLHRDYRTRHKMHGNIKDWEEDDVAEWVDQEEVASYHTMTVPYGEKYNAAKINRLLYAKDLLLNAEWNQPDDREVYLHRHPCFFGTAEEVLQDCCGFCPVPKTDEEIDVAKEESKIYISGKLQFIMDDPGRQEIGSFNPITDDEWTTMAYVGDTARLCQAIVDGDLEHVQDWCAQEGVDVNRRDYTGRTPLHLAVMASTLEIVKCLIDNGARLIARLVDGRTALHLAAARGDVGMVKALMDRSLANQEEEDEKEEARRMVRKTERSSQTNVGDKAAKHKVEMDEDANMSDAGSEASEITLDSDDDKDEVMTMGSFVKVEKDDKTKIAQEGALEEDSTDDPDIYEIDVIAWDYGLSPLHMAILNGHLDIIELLVGEYAADVLLPVKFFHAGTSTPRGAIMTIVLAMSLPTEKAKAVVKLLLELGATTSQADLNHFTAFHYVVAANNHDILDVLLENDRPVALSILDNIGSQMYGNDGDSPLTTAISKGYKEMVSTLLSLGAKPTTDFDEWIKAYLFKNEYAKRNTPDQNQKLWRDSVCQPIIAAAAKEMGESVRDLLAHGADPSTLEKSAYRIIETPQNAAYQVAESLLDIVQKKLKALREFDESTGQNSGGLFGSSGNAITKEPEKLEEESFYTKGLKEGTYEHWTALHDYQTKKQANTKEREAWKKAMERKKEEGLDEKKAAVATIVKELEKTEKALIEAGAKTFVEMYPDLPKHQPHVYQPYQYPEPGPYKTNLSFRIPDLNDAKKEGYMRLFEAAWNGDLETIKKLTLAPWKLDMSSVEMTPLQIATMDMNGFSPFSIAVLHGHYELARKIIEICATQYHKDDGLSTKQRWNMATMESDDEDDSDDEDMPIFAELVSDKFTVDNLGEVSSIVKSSVLPATMIAWHCAVQRFLDNEKKNDDGTMRLLEYAVHSSDMKMLKFLVALNQEQLALQATDEDDPRCYTIDRDVFHTAIKLGRTSMLAEMIKSTGVGIPLDDLIQKSGFEIKTKPRYYQGLSVGGKKRADWAQAPGEYVQKVSEESIPPLLRAAYVGSMDSVEWFMSDAPLRRYKEFAEINKNDKRIKTLEESGKGFDRTIGAWLDAKNELVLHAAILHNPSNEEDNPKYMALIKHLLSVVPETLEQKSSQGWTPLQIAVWARRADVASYLISQGANQRSRDKMGRNMLHSMLTNQSNGGAITDIKRLRAMIELFDKDAVKEMMVERCTLSPGALTPLALWMSNNKASHKKADIAVVLAEYATGEELEMINGEGDLPLHVATKQSLSTLTSHLLSRNPDLLYRENATGRTPLEMSRDIYTASQVAKPVELNSGFHHRYYPGQQDYNSIIHQPSSNFAKKDDQPEESKKRTWEICVEMDSQMGKEGKERKRRIVSLFEANEVAKRIASVNKHKCGGNQVVVNGGLVDGEGKEDLISGWMLQF